MNIECFAQGEKIVAALVHSHTVFQSVVLDDMQSFFCFN